MARELKLNPEELRAMSIEVYYTTNLLLLRMFLLYLDASDIASSDKMVFRGLRHPAGFAM